MEFLIKKAHPGFIIPEHTDIGNVTWFLVFEKGKEDKYIAYGGYYRNDLSGENIYFGPTLVNPEYRGKGIQLMLLQEREREAKKEGYKKAITGILPDNKWSRANVEKAGFKKTSFCGTWDWYEKILD